MTRAALIERAFVEGNAASPVRVIAYEDLQCGDCAEYRRMLDEQLLPTFGQSVAFESRDFPLAKHPWARLAAIAARHFKHVHPELGTAFRRYCYQHQAVIAVPSFPKYLRDFAKTSGIDPEKAIDALSDGNHAAEVDAQHREGIARGVIRTPTVFANGEAFVETFSFERIGRAIESAIDIAGAKN
jgi:protein-disulfide isomerase